MLTKKQIVELSRRAAVDSSRIEELDEAGRLVVRETPNGEIVQCEAAGGLVRALGDNGIVEVIASDETQDRYGDVIEQRGWKLDAYRKNPVILVDHDYRVNSIVGRATKVAVEKADEKAAKAKPRQLKAKIQLDNGDEHLAARVVESKLRSRSLRTVSVGFVPLEWEKIVDDEDKWTGGFIFRSAELLEISFVAVPANPSAVVVDAVAPEVSVNGDAALTVRLQDIVDHVAMARIERQLRRL